MTIFETLVLITLLQFRVHHEAWYGTQGEVLLLRAGGFETTPTQQEWDDATQGHVLHRPGECVQYCTLYNIVQCTMYIVHCTVYDVHRTLQWTLYNVQYVLSNSY